MHDYRYITTDGKRIPVAELPTALIVELLGEPGFHIEDPAHPGENSDAVKKRLDLEIFIRRMGLRK